MKEWKRSHQINLIRELNGDIYPINQHPMGEWLIVPSHKDVCRYYLREVVYVAYGTILNNIIFWNRKTTKEYKTWQKAFRLNQEQDDGSSFE